MRGRDGWIDAWIDAWMDVSVSHCTDTQTLSLARIATPVVWYSDVPIPEKGHICCDNSIVAYTTNDGGDTWWVGL